MKWLSFGILLLLLAGCDPGERVVPQIQRHPAPSAGAEDDLKNRVFDYNNRLQYDSSLMVLQAHIAAGNDSLRYICYLLTSQTYKRVFEYDEVFRYLDSAQHVAAKSWDSTRLLNAVAAEQAFAFFDVQQYGKADSLMRLLRGRRYLGLNNQQKVFLVMQEGYLQFKQNNYGAADLLFKEAIRITEPENEKDLPVIYGKQIELLLAQHQDAAADSVYQLAMAAADRSGILKYKMYVTDVTRSAYLDREDYKAAYKYIHIGDSLTVMYNTQAQINKLTELEAKYKLAQKEQELISSRNKEVADQRLIAFLVAALLSGGLAILIVFLLRRQRQARRNRLMRMRFTAQLFEKTEEERQRIAVDLHDGISHELLYLKKVAPHTHTQVDHIINEIRTISRNLHPAMFERVGLKLSIEQLVERIQQQNNFLVSLEIDYQQQFPAPIELQIYRIIQEGLNNVLKHAKAHAAFVALKTAGPYTELILKDNGIGFVVTEKVNNPASFGIHNIMERAEAIGGKAKFQSGAEGTCITIHIPNKKK